MFNLRRGVLTAAAAAILITITFILAPFADAQPVRYAEQLLPSYLPNHASLQSEGFGLSVQEMNRIVDAARNDSPFPATARVMEGMKSQIEMAIHSSESSTFSFVNDVADSSHSLLEHKRFSMNALYEPRPSGGILNLTVAIKPAFSGVGIRNRAIVSESASEVVEELTVASLGSLLQELTIKLQHRSVIHGRI
jgi:hypothetical protein